MSTNQCLNSSQNQFSKFGMDDRADKTRSTQNFSKLCENCRLIKDELQAEIFTLKDKSHQSFMQVIQVQQLHEEQMQLMKIQHQEEITALRQQISKLEAEVFKNKEEFIIMQKNSKHHICYVQQPSFLIENIEMIECFQDDGDKKSKLDQSSFDQFNEIVESRNSNLHQPFLKPRSGQIRQSNNSNITASQQKIQRLSLRILELQSEVQSLWQTNQELKKQCMKLEANEKSIKNNYDSLYKESKFMADHIRGLANDKFKLQRKVKELEKEIKELKGKGLKQSGILSDQKQSMMSIKINGSDLFNSQDMIDNVRNSMENSREDRQIIVSEQKDNVYQRSKSNGTCTMNDKYHQLPNKEINPTPNLSKPIPTATINLPANPNNFGKPRSNECVMIKSEMFQQNADLQLRKSMPNYKKVSHISPSFKKATSTSKGTDQKAENNSLLRIVDNENARQHDKSDFMDEIRREVQLKAGLKKGVGMVGHYEGPKTSLFHQNFKKRSSAQ